jgi:hypothetical protein
MRAKSPSFRFRRLKIEALERRQVNSASSILPGDVNQDGKVSVADVSALMTVLSDKTTFEVSRSLSDAQFTQLCDLNGDGRVDNLDIQGLISHIANASSQPPTWFDSHVQTSGIRTLADTDYQDGVLSRADMMGLFRGVEQLGVVTATELSDLTNIISNSSLFGGLNYVQVLSSDIVLGNAANAHYLGTTLGNLAVGSSATQLEDLVDKWFLGTDHPLGKADTGAIFSYSAVSGQLFVNGPSYSDVRQGLVSDCYFLSSLAETALRNPTAIMNMFIVNGDGTYTVSFYNGSRADYVTVDQQLPTSGGKLVFDGKGAGASDPKNELWVALAEKAYVQMNESGWIRPAAWGGGQNVYTSISTGFGYMALGQITGQATDPLESPVGSSLAAAFAAGKSIVLTSTASPSSAVIGSHVYAVLSVDSTAQTVTLFNPWGLNNSHDSGVITLTWPKIAANFTYFDQTD